MLNICVVVVTHNSSEYIERLMIQLFNQSHNINKIVVVDNASKDDTVSIIKRVAKLHNNIDLFENSHNLGGAGGFRLGLEKSLIHNSDYIITFDDDAQLLDKNYLSKISDYAQKQKLDVVGSLVVSIENSDVTAHKYLLNNQRTTSVRELVTSLNIVSEIKLFNGTLFASNVVKDLKGPDPRFFIRGDEIEFRNRIYNSEYKFATCVDAVIYHPELISDEIIYRGKVLSYIEHKGKQYFSTRNRYYFYINRIKHQHTKVKMIRILLKDFIRYSQFYLTTNGDFLGYCVWFRAFIDGLTSNLNSSFSQKMKKKYFD